MPGGPGGEEGFPVSQVDGAGRPVRETSGRGGSKPTSPAGERADKALGDLDAVLGEFGDPGMGVTALTPKELEDKYGIEPPQSRPSVLHRAHVAPPAGSALIHRMNLAKERDEVGTESDGELD